MIGGLALLALQAASPAPTATPTGLDAAMRCRAYAPLASVFLAQEDHRRFTDFWVKRTEGLGKAVGLSDDALAMRVLIIPITASEADATLSSCLEQWGETLPARR